MDRHIVAALNRRRSLYEQVMSASEGFDEKPPAPACWPATLQPRWGAPGEDQAPHQLVRRKRRSQTKHRTAGPSVHPKHREHHVQSLVL